MRPGSYWERFTLVSKTLHNKIKIKNFKGKVEAEFIILNEQNANEQPAGLGRNEPDPLPDPK